MLRYSSPLRVRKLRPAIARARFGRSAPQLTKHDSKGSLVLTDKMVIRRSTIPNGLEPWRGYTKLTEMLGDLPVVFGAMGRAPGSSSFLTVR
jgi:hypothetical protein